MEQKQLYSSANIGPQAGEAPCDGNEQVTEKKNKGDQIDNKVWGESQNRLRTAADQAFLNAHSL